MVFVAFERLESDAQGFCGMLDGVFDGGEDGGGENRFAILDAKDQVCVKERDGMAVSAVSLFHEGVPVNSWYCQIVTHMSGMEMMAYRYRLYPTSEQAVYLLQVAGSCRFVYNLALERRNRLYNETGQAPSVNEMVKAVTQFKKEHPFLRQAMAQPLQQAVRDMCQGWVNFLEGRAQRPTWRKFADAPSFRLPDPAQFKIKNLPGSKKNRRHLHLPKMGMSGSLGPVEMVLHRPIEGKVKNATISREGEAWYVSFCVEIRGNVVHSQREMMGLIADRLEREAFDELTITGADRNTATNGAVVTNWGDVYGVVIKTAAMERKQAKLQRVVARKEEALRKAHGIKPGGSLKGVERPNRLKAAQVRLRKFTAKLARIRKHGAHDISRKLVTGSDIIVLEALETKAMTSKERDKGVSAWEKKRNKKTRKDILDVGWAMIESFALYKARLAGKMVVLVNPAYTSQRCYECGHSERANRDENDSRVFHCVSCGHEADANVNAGWNIRHIGMEVLKEKIQQVKAGERLEWPCLRLEGSKSLLKGEKRSVLVGLVPHGAGYPTAKGKARA